MDDELTQLIQERVSELPETLRAILASRDLIPAIAATAAKYKLSEEKAALLQREVILILLAFEPLVDFSANLVRELMVPLPVAQSITEDLDALVFERVSGELARIAEQRRVQEKDTDTARPDAKAAEPQPPATTPSTPKEPVHDRPFYAQTPNYAKPFVPHTPTTPRSGTPPTPPQSHADDPYHEPI